MYIINEQTYVHWGCMLKNILLKWDHYLNGWIPLQDILVLFRRSVMSDSLWPHGLQHTRLPLSFTISQNLLKLMSIESVIPSNHLILCRPLLLLPSIFPTIRVFSNESAFCIGWPKYLSFREQIMYIILWHNILLQDINIDLCAIQ